MNYKKKKKVAEMTCIDDEIVRGFCPFPLGKVWFFICLMDSARDKCDDPRGFLSQRPSLLQHTPPPKRPERKRAAAAAAAPAAPAAATIAAAAAAAAAASGPYALLMHVCLIERPKKAGADLS